MPVVGNDWRSASEAVPFDKSLERAPVSVQNYLTVQCTDASNAVVEAVGQFVALIAVRIAASCQTWFDSA